MSDQNMDIKSDQVDEMIRNLHGATYSKKTTAKSKQLEIRSESSDQFSLNRS